MSVLPSVPPEFRTPIPPEPRPPESRIALAEEADRLQRARAELAASQRRLQAATQAANMGVWEASGMEEEVYFSQIARSLAWLPEEGALTMNDFLERLCPEGQDGFRDLVMRLWERGEAFQHETCVQSPTKETRWLQLTGSSLYDDTGVRTGMVGTVIDITSRRREAGEMQRALELAEAGAHAKSDFLARMSHEIRTPMNAILAPAHLLAESALNASQRELVLMIQQAAEHLLDVINAILDFSKLESGKMTLVEEVFDIGTLVGDALAPFGIIAGNKEIQLSYSIGSEALGFWTGDPARVRQVILNLVSNALKFTRIGEVEVIVKYWPGEGDIGSGLDIRVRDTGCGLSLQETERIFLPFEQSPFSESRRPGGTGLGLAICRELVDLMGGIIGVESAPGQGSEFWFCIPLSKAEPGGREAVPPEASPAEAAFPENPPYVLVVEDNASNRKVVSLLLKKIGCNVSVAADGVQALEACNVTAFDLVLMDCEMPVMDGYECVRKIREKEREGRPRTPVVALSAHVSPEHKALCLSSGMDGVLSKPVALAELRATVQKWHTTTPAQNPPAPAT